jgi:hypothetical protein
MSLKTNLYVDIAIFCAFLVAFEPSLTGFPVHEWLSLAFAGAMLVHLLLHWDWVVMVTSRFFRKLFHSSRLNYILDALLLIMFITVMLSGIMISRSVLPAIGIQGAADPTWRFLHSSSADFLLLLVGLHFALHWKWVVSACTHYIISPLKQRLEPRQAQPALVPVRKERE